MRFQLRPGGAMDALLDLPWHEPLDRWDAASGVDVDGTGPDGRAIVLDSGVLELRELPGEDAERANDVLRVLRQEGVPVVEVVGVVLDRVGRDGVELPAVLLTVRPPHSLDHVRVLDGDVPEGADAVLDAAVAMLVQLHLEGFVWHGASLGAMRFRHDAGRLSATLVDVGDGELRDPLSMADRLRDLEAATATIADELVDAGTPVARESLDVRTLRSEMRRRYRRLWHELTRAENLDPGDRERGDARLRRVNELGFDVEEIQVVGDGPGVRLGPAVLEPGHHRRRLWRLTHLVVQENQARRLLEEIDHFRAAEPTAGHRDVEETEAAAAMRWLHEVFRPTVAAVPAELRPSDLDDAEVFHEILEHRYYLSERAGHDVGTATAADAYVTDVLTESRRHRAAG